MSLLKREDLVQVISGADKGKRGKVLRVDHDKYRVIVQGVGLVYKHLKRSQKHPNGGRIQLESSIAISNVMFVDPKTDEPTRMRRGVGKAGKRIRMSVKSGNPV
ncbi:MAG TPA: 50S ribosomal protein L24 [Planctomycetes bacterium]|nr:50S ribosomal protein L24 [Planctomycetota bacterium]HIN79856.1 50S ribosomal protein L24 [Planctomycetota bacterium]